MKIRAVIAAALCWLASPLGAQVRPPQAPTATSAAPVDAGRLALARQMVERVWPPGTYRRMMEATMGPMMDQIMAGMMNTKVEDMAPGAAASRRDRGITLRELAAAEDPAFQERLRITNQVTMREMSNLMTRMEPRVREALARVYAREFTAPQLVDLAQFFATPTGTEYAAKSMLLFTNPEMLQAVQSFVPEMMREMPAILAEVRQATAHLPPPPQRKSDR